MNYNLGHDQIIVLTWIMLKVKPHARRLYKYNYKCNVKQVCISITLTYLTSHHSTSLLQAKLITLAALAWQALQGAKPSPPRRGVAELALPHIRPPSRAALRQSAEGRRSEAKLAPVGAGVAPT